MFRHGIWQTSDETDALLEACVASCDGHARCAGLGRWVTAMTAGTHADQVARIHRWIRDGDGYQVNLTFGLSAPAFGAPVALYQRLRARQAVAHGAFIADTSGAILSRSPELFVERSGRMLRCRPMKGTAAAEPSGSPEHLGSSEKDRAENLMIVDLLRNDLGRLVPPGGVQVSSLFAVERYATVHQMTSTILAEPCHAGLVDILKALFPCGSVTGAPKIAAMRQIRALEAAPRGLYCGALGWLAPDGDFRLSVPIRTLRIDARRQARLDIGSGIVADSIAANEWHECAVKRRFADALTPPLQLLETMRVEPGPPPRILRLSRHLERLATSADLLGFHCQVAELRRALTTHVAENASSGPQRLRLRLNPDGRFVLDSDILTAIDAPVHLGIARMTLNASDPLLRHKTTCRRDYDAAIRCATGHGWFDLLFMNERGELVEGARSNLFVEAGIGQPLLTPPLSSGCLPGVLRAELLASGQAVEAVMHADMLAGPHRIFVGNALRGLLEVSDIDPVPVDLPTD